MKKVLIVDDAAFMRNTLKLILERNGFEVIGEAGDGSDAVKRYSELIPDIVTMDITMPKMDGIEALRMIRTIDSNATVIMMTAMGQESYVRKAVMQGAKGFILKPWKEDDVIKVLNNI
jgi:Response regulator containing CheY-like receiver domain and AraC-type DNA-binding domain